MLNGSISLSQLLAIGGSGGSMVPPYPVEQKVKLDNWLLFLQQASASVYYWITDINDHYPHFSSQHYNVTVGEVSDNNCSHSLILSLDFL